MKTKLLLSIIVLACFGMNAFAGDKSTKELRGDKYFFVYSFDKAIDSYTHAKKLSVEGHRRLAESYCNIGRTIEAEAAYSELLSLPGGNLPDDYYNYAMVLKTNGKSEHANLWMDKFVELKSDDLRAKDYVAHKAEFRNLSKDNGKYEISHLNMNTNAQDFSPSYYQDKVVFVSSGKNPDLMKKTYNWNGKPFLDMHVSEMEQGQLKTSENFDKRLNSKMHDGPASFSKDGTYMAFTRNNYDTKRKDKIVELQICFSSYKDEKWSKPAPFFLNNPDYSVGQPCLTDDGNTMYFTSDMPGGYGGADIYRVKKDEMGGWGNTENMGNTVNTEGDEMFPFYEEKNNVLFFASNGRYGLGGLDIFIYETDNFGVARVTNAGAPLNTQYDDFAAIVNESMSSGYFSSNRSGGNGDDDVYSFNILNIEKQLIGIAKEKDGDAIPETFITLLDDKGNVIDTLTTQYDGAYTFLVASDKNVTLIGKKEKYLEGYSFANTFGKELIVRADVILLREEIVVQEIPEGVDLGEVVGLNPIYYDLDKYNIRPDAEVELKKIIKIVNDNPAMVVELGSHTDCRASKGYNQILSNNRANASAEYIKKRITNPERIYSKGYGETRLINGCSCEGIVVSTCSKEEYQQDRRTEFIIISNNKVRQPIGRVLQP